MIKFLIIGCVTAFLLLMLWSMCSIAERGDDWEEKYAAEKAAKTDSTTSSDTKILYLTNE